MLKILQLRAVSLAPLPVQELHATLASQRSATKFSKVLLPISSIQLHFSFLMNLPIPSNGLPVSWASRSSLQSSLTPPFASLVVQTVKNLPETKETREYSPGEGNGNPPQYSCLENPMDRGAWWATVHGAAEDIGMTQQLNNNNKLCREHLIASTQLHPPCHIVSFYHQSLFPPQM